MNINNRNRCPDMWNHNLFLSHILLISSFQNVPHATRKRERKRVKQISNFFFPLLYCLCFFTLAWSNSFSISFSPFFFVCFVSIILSHFEYCFISISNCQSNREWDSVTILIDYNQIKMCLNTLSDKQKMIILKWKFPFDR